MTPHELAHELEIIYGDEIKSVVLYGSAAGENHSQKFSDYNIFCVLSNPTPALLAKSNRVIRKWVRRGNPPPLFFGMDHFERSLDVFPIEFLDMMDRHGVLFGGDPFEDARVDKKNLRHQCESELKGKLLHLRAFYAANCHKPKRLARMMVDSFPAFLAAFRSTLRLAGEKPAGGSDGIVEKAAQIAKFNPEIFLEIVAIRHGTSYLPRGDEALAAFERYLTELEVITTFVDRMI